MDYDYDSDSTLYDEDLILDPESLIMEFDNNEILTLNKKEKENYIQLIKTNIVELNTKIDKLLNQNKDVGYLLYSLYYYKKLLHVFYN